MDSWCTAVNQDVAQALACKQNGTISDNQISGLRNSSPHGLSTAHHHPLPIAYPGLAGPWGGLLGPVHSMIRVWSDTTLPTLFQAV